MPKKNKGKKKSDDWNDEEEDKNLEEKMKELSTGDETSQEKGKKKKPKVNKLQKLAEMLAQEEEKILQQMIRHRRKRLPIKNHRKTMWLVKQQKMI